MKRPLIGNLLLLLVAGLLGIVVWQAQQSDRLERLTDLSAEQITRIETSGLSGRYIKLEKREGSWWIDKAPANSERIAELLRICATPSLVRFEAPADLAPFGLSTPQVVLKLNNQTLSFGDTDPVNGWRYVGYDGQIHLIVDGFYHHLVIPTEAWLERP